MSDSEDISNKLATLQADILFLKSELTKCSELNEKQERRLHRLSRLLHRKINHGLLIGVVGFAATFALIIRVDINSENGIQLTNKLVDSALTLIVTGVSATAAVKAVKAQGE